MKKNFLTIALLLIVGTIFSQSIKGPEQISYFQAPSEGIQYKYADVYLMPDKALQKAQKEAQQGKNSAMGAKFGAVGNAIANTANQAMDIIEKSQNAIDALKDEKGRFAVWSFIPPYIIANDGTKESVIVEIYFLNEEDKSPMAGQALKPDKNGYYNIPYNVYCRYKVSTVQGETIINKNLGLLKGTRKSKNYTPPAPAGGIGSVTVTNEGLSEAEKIGINVAYNRVRQDVFARFGFGTFASPIKLGVIKEIKSTKKLIKPMLAIFENKKGLLLSNEEKDKVRNFIQLIEKDINKCSDKTRWVAFHNLSVCYAWVEEPEKAKEYYQKYTQEIKETIDKMERWNLLLEGKLPKDQRKTAFIGMKDMKKYQNYNDIGTFVSYYPAGAKRYQKLFKTINRDLGRFVDFYAHNDLLCQLYEIDYPFQFFPLQDFAGMPKKMEGSISKEGSEAIDFKVKFDSKRRIKELSTEQIKIDDNGKKDKLYSRDLMPQYDKESGDYLEIITDAGNWSQIMTSSVYFYGDIRSIYDPLVEKTYCKAENITKKSGFFGDKSSSEGVQLKVDLEGNLFFTGKSAYFQANAIFLDMMKANGLEPKRKDTYSSFKTKATINEQGIFTLYSWDGSVKTSFYSLLSGPIQYIEANKMLREIEVLEQDEHGNPTKLNYNFEMKGKLNVGQKMSIKEWFAESYAQGSVPKSKISSESFELGSKMTWDCSFKYDEQGNWIEMKVGPYTATRTFKY